MRQHLVPAVLALVCLVLAFTNPQLKSFAAESGHNTAVYTEHGGNVHTIDSGGTLGVESGGAINAKSGSSSTFAGTVTVSGNTTETGVHTIDAAGALVQAVGSKHAIATTTISTTTTLTAATSGTRYTCPAEDITVTLPAVAAGLYYGFHAGSVTGATGLVIHPAGTAKMYGNGFTAAAGKGAKLTHATARVGDFIFVFCDGTDWWIFAISGTWAREA